MITLLVVDIKRYSFFYNLSKNHVNYLHVPTNIPEGAVV